MSASILFERSIPIVWSALPQAGLPECQEQNHLVLGLLDSLDESAVRKPEQEQAGDMQRMETKLNIIIQLLGQLLREREQLPDKTTVRFSSEGLAWQSAQPPSVGSLLAVSLYPEDSLPLPLRFSARVISVSAGWLEVDMHGLAQDELTVWSRWVFRQHRRQVAMARTQSEPA